MSFLFFLSWCRGRLFRTLILCISATSVAWGEPRCLFVSSYHEGYSWSEGVEKGLRSVLEGRCDYRAFYMDTKRNKSEEYMKWVAAQAKELIDEWKPDIVITADDNAARYLVKPYFRDASLPVVFCGVNWSVDEYGFPYSNVTGMVEVAPIQPLLHSAFQLVRPLRRAYYLGAETVTERKNLERFRAELEKKGVEVVPRLVRSRREWLEAYREAQEGDLLVLGSHAGIPDWDEEKVRREIDRVSQVLTVTNHGWMMPVAMLGFTKIPEEQGTWAGRTALAILEEGISPADIPIIANRRWDLWINPELLERAGIRLPDRLRKRAKRVVSR